MKRPLPFRPCRAMCSISCRSGVTFLAVSTAMALIFSARMPSLAWRSSRSMKGPFGSTLGGSFSSRGFVPFFWFSTRFANASLLPFIRRWSSMGSIFATIWSCCWATIGTSKISIYLTRRYAWGNPIYLSVYPVVPCISYTGYCSENGYIELSCTIWSFTFKTDEYSIYRQFCQVSRLLFTVYAV